MVQRLVEQLPQFSCDDVLYIACRETPRLRGDVLTGLRDIIAVAPVAPDGMSRHHPSAMPITDQSVEQANLTGAWPGGVALEQGLRGIPPRLIEDRLMLAGIDLIAMSYLTDVEPVAQQIA